MKTRKIYFCNCKEDVEARMTDGSEVYSHRPDLASLPFWKCDACKGFVGCHHKTKEQTKPLGVIPSRELKRARSEIHRILDPVWKRGKMKRGALYDEIAQRLGIEEYHTAELRDIETARNVYRIVVDIRKRHGLTRRAV